MPQVSVIVPVYNTEQYLSRCIDSILTQTYPDFELILLDDGSTDGSGAICDEYEEKDDRIQVIHKLNGGAASTRNVGIDVAKGEYIAFCDSDDLVSPMWLQHMVALADEITLPMGASCEKCNKLGGEKPLQFKAGEYYQRSNYFLFNQAGIAGFLWNALFRKDIVDNNGIRLREQRELGDFNEDLLFTLTYIEHIDRIIYTGYTDYFYNTRENSLSRANHQFYFEKYAEKYRLWSSFICREHNRVDEELRELSSGILFHFLTALHYNYNSFGTIKKIVLSEEMQTCINLADTKNENSYEVRFIQKKRLYLIYFFYRLLRLKGYL